MMTRRLVFFSIAAFGALVPVAALATEAAGAATHVDPTAGILLRIAVILFAAKIGAGLAVRLNQPPVLGELLAGVALGNAALAGLPWLTGVTTPEAIDLLGQLGVILLLFETGLESSIAQMLRVGPSSFLVAALGVVTPFALGWAVGAALLPEAGPYVHAFLGATLTATSVGITARVLRDLALTRRPEARIILGAAVIDDVLGLVILAAVAAAIGAADRGVPLSLAGVGVILLKAAAFLVGALVLGSRISPRIFALAARLPAHGVLLATALGFCFLLAWLAALAGLAPIVGAFAAGLILMEVHYRDFTQRGERGLDLLVRPISSFLAPVFFVLMGARTDLSVFARPGVLGLAGALVVAAALGKLACAFGVLDRRARRLPVALGMIPRGEVGLIFANVGLTLVVAGRPVVDSGTYSAVVVMVFVTTMMTPALLAWSFRRH